MSAGVSNKIAKGLCKAFKGTVFTKTGCCIKLEAKHFVEGVSIERTSYKETFYVWSFINPIWTERCLTTLSYSERIAGGQYFAGSAENITEEIILEIRNNALYLSRVSGPETTARLFLNTVIQRYPQIVDYAKINGHKKAFDFGIAFALDNRLKDSKEILEAFSTSAHRSYHYLRLCARAIVTSLQAGDQAYLDVIADMEEQGRFTLPFELRGNE